MTVLDVAGNQRMETLLTSSIPNLHLDVVIAVLDHLGTELHSDGDFVLLSVPLIGVLQQQALLANA